MSGKRKEAYQISDESDDEQSESIKIDKPTHSRTNTNTKLNSSSVKVESMMSSDSYPESSGAYENSSEINEHEDSNDVVEQITRQHTLKTKNDEHKQTNGSAQKERGKVNSLLGALTRNKVNAIRAMNAAQNKIPEHDEVELTETTGLSTEQQEQLKQTKCLYRYNASWRVYWDMFVMTLAVWN